MSSAIAGPSKRHHSTLVDPNFVENYFKKSRLQFIGTWRSRFPSSIYTSSNVNVSGQGLLLSMWTWIVSLSRWSSGIIQNYRIILWLCAILTIHEELLKFRLETTLLEVMEYGREYLLEMQRHFVLSLLFSLMTLELMRRLLISSITSCINIATKCRLSCDEAFLEVRDFEVEDPRFLASVIRKEIVETTGCTASAGISGNLLMARLATKAAKPDGQCYIPPEKVDDYLNELSIKSLPGIGHVLEEELKRKQIQTCGQLLMISKESLQKEFGVKTGDMLWNHSRGVDNRLVGVIQERKSVGAEVNWGVRFNDVKDVGISNAL